MFYFVFMRHIHRAMKFKPDVFVVSPLIKRYCSNVTLCAFASNNLCVMSIQFLCAVESILSVFESICVCCRVNFYVLSSQQRSRMP